MKEQQRYRCKNCGYQYTKTTPRGKLEKDKILALILYLSGLLMNDSEDIGCDYTKRNALYSEDARQVYNRET